MSEETKPHNIFVPLLDLLAALERAAATGADHLELEIVSDDDPGNPESFKVAHFQVHDDVNKVT